MGLQTYAAQFLATPQTPIINPQTNAAVTNFYYMLLALFNRTGQGTGTPLIATGLTAAASFATAQTKGNPALIVNDWSVFNTVASGGVCAVPAVNVGSDFIIWNFGAHSLAITPQPTQAIDALGLGNPYNLAANKMQWFRCPTTNQMYSMQLG